MKSQKLLIIAAIVCLLVGASGAAMAVEDCAGGWLSGIIEEDVIVTDQTCRIKDAEIFGDVNISGAPHAFIFASQVSGNIVVNDSAIVTIVSNTAKNIRARRNAVTVVHANVARRKIVVNRNDNAGVTENIGIVAIICKNNDELDARFNNTEGEDECRR